MRAETSHASIEPDAVLAGWTWMLGPPGPEPRRSRRMAHLGAVVSIGALVLYLTWRISFTMPTRHWDLVFAWVLVTFEALPLAGLVVRITTLWNIDSKAPPPVYVAGPGQHVAVMIPTYNEPAEVIAPTIAAAVMLEPAHETWVCDDGDRPWVEALCQEYGARYVRREVHDHAKAGNMNHALALMEREAGEGAPVIDILAVLDCDHVPLPTFLTATIGWFDDPGIALVQAPQSYYNSGAFDDDGVTGEQGMFFHVLLKARNHDAAGPFWCGSTSLIRATALREVGGVNTTTIVEDMHTTLDLIRTGWKTVYHHQTLAVGLAPDTPEQYLLQRRRWGMGSMQVLATERLWSAKRWLSWRNYYEYLSGTLWWLEGVFTIFIFVIPLIVMFSGAQTSTASPLAFGTVFVAMFAARMWGTKRLFRHHIHWRTAFALRIFRVPVGLSCFWWLLTRKSLKFEVTPKAGAEERLRGRAPTVLWALILLVTAAIAYAVLGVFDVVPWRTSAPATIASGAYLCVADLVLILGFRRIMAAEYATSRRNAHRVLVKADVVLDGVRGELVDVSVGGAAVRFPSGRAPTAAEVILELPGAEPITMVMVRVAQDPEAGDDVVSLRLAADDWTAYRAMSLWLFHTPDGVIRGIPAGVPAVAATQWIRTPRAFAEQVRRTSLEAA